MTFDEMINMKTNKMGIFVRLLTTVELTKNALNLLCFLAYCS